MRALSLLICVLSATFTVAAQPVAPPAIAISGVNIIPMDRERVLINYTLILRDGRIAEAGPAQEIKIPTDMQTIDARGKYVVPGLAEMHGHLIGDNTALNELILRLYVLHGVTTLRVMQGHPTHLELRERVNSRQLFGPRMYVSAPALSGGSAPTAKVAITFVKQAKQQGYDLLKIQEGLSRSVFDAVAETADRVGIPFAGHVPADVGVHRALQAHFRSIDHIDGYLEALVPVNAGVDLTRAGLFGSAIIDHVDESKIPALVRETLAAGTAIVPTETVARNFLTPEPIQQLFAPPEFNYLPHAMIDGWKRQKSGVIRQLGNMSPAQLKRYHAVRRKLIKTMHSAGVPILLGSDSPQVLNVPGVSIADELELMVKAGLTPYEALASGTCEVAKHFGTLEESGTVEVGKRADLLILNADPLQDVGRTRERFGVVVNGQWLSRADIDNRLRNVKGPPAP